MGQLGGASLSNCRELRAEGESTRSLLAISQKTPLPVKTATGAMPDIQSTLPVSHPGIQRYDLASHSWSQVTTPPANGDLLEVTPSNTHGGAILWYVDLQGSHYALYRYEV